MNERDANVDVLVAGGGVVGVAAAAAVAERGPSVALVEAGGLDERRGSSRGRSRICVPAGFPDDSYLRAGVAAGRRWEEIEARSGRPLIRRSGVLSFGAFAGEQAAALSSAGEVVESVSAEDARRRFGVHLGEGVPIIFQPEAGVIEAGDAHAAVVGLARDAGVRLAGHEALRRVVAGGSGFRVETSRGSWSCKVVVVAAGPWSGPILTALGFDYELMPTSQTVVFLETRERPADLGPALIDYEGEEPYSLWERDGTLKLGFHARGPEVDPDGPSPPPDPVVVERLRRWAEDRYPEIDFSAWRAETCIYTNTPDERFILDRRGGVVVASACNGQGFQLAPESGASAAALALDALEGAPGALI